jgi:hypothetical protein
MGNIFILLVKKVWILEIKFVYLSIIKEIQKSELTEARG